jgi:asparagine synthase (glutamine-hydrolysing)
MPGIVGLITRMPRDRADLELRQMLAVVGHEGFYVRGMWADSALGVYVAWVARKGSFSDGMPLKNERGDVVLVFSGEEFPGPGTAQRLKERGHDIDLDDPSYLVHLYEEDSSFPAELNGRFHGLLVDRNRGTVVLFNDRYGMNRLYYHESKYASYFAAEAKAILAVRPELRNIDPQGLGEFVSCGAVLENRTLFDGIHVLPPASAWVFRKGELERKASYFHPREWEQQEKLEPESFYRELRDVFARNLPRYFDGEEEIGMSLTGGLDTRMILAWQKCEPGSLPCYTFGSMLRENQDVRVARRVANLCEQAFQVIPAGREFLSQFSHYAERAVYLTDGCVDVGRAPDLYLNEKAREIAPVRMTGNYGGEVLRKVRAFKPEEPVSGLFHPDFMVHIRRTNETYAGLVQGHPVSFAAFKQTPWHHYGIFALEQTQLSHRSPFLDNDFVRTVFRAPDSALTGDDVCLRLIADGNEALSRIPTDRGVGGSQGPISGAASRGVLELLFKAEYAYDMGMPQWVAGIDHVLSPLHLERLFLGRHKVFHFRIWYRDYLAEYVREMLLDPRSLSRPHIDRKGVEAIVEGHLKGDRNYTNDLHKVLTLELVHRLFLDNVETGATGAESETPTAQTGIIGPPPEGSSELQQMTRNLA